jgi:hypothetical protein
MLKNRGRIKAPVLPPLLAPVLKQIDTNPLVKLISRKTKPYQIMIYPGNEAGLLLTIEEYRSWLRSNDRKYDSYVNLPAF